MPLGEAIGEVIGEIIFRFIFELVFLGFFYGTGFVLLKIITFGTIRLAPLESFRDKNRGKGKWYQVDWSIWLNHSKKKRELKAGCTCVVGILFWVAVGFGIYFATRDGEEVVTRVEVSGCTFEMSA